MEQELSQQELFRLLQELRQGKLSPDEIYNVLVDFGRMRFLEARPDVERLLHHEDQQVRYMALNVLTLDWHLKEYWKTALDVLEHDPDDDNRLRAATVLDALKKNTGDPLVLRALARVVRNENENEFVRKAAYHAMQSILHDPTPRERLVLQP
jgi:HEAT repeat protein